jgi:hypothetical protein
VLVPAFFVLVLVVSEWFGLLSSRTPRTPRVPLWGWITALALSYAAQLAIVLYASHHQYPVAAWRRAMPLAVVDDRGLGMQNADLATASMLALAALQSYALLAVYRHAHAPSDKRWVALGCAVMLLFSLAAPALISFDMYGYAHDAVLGLAAYNPPNIPFTGEYRIFDLWFGHPSPTLYGPLWIVLVRIVTFFGATLFGKLVAWRVFCVALYVALLGGLRALRVPQRIFAVAALNPGLMLQFVANGHNDMIAIVLLVFAAALIRAQAWIGPGLIAVSGLIKLPYAVLGLPILAALSMRRRILAATAAMAIVAALSWAGGGRGYLASLVGHIGSRPEDVMHRAAGAVALVLVAIAFFGGRRLRSGVWAMPMLGAYMFSWYFIWGLPYALAKRRVLSYLLVCFPFAMMLLETAFLRLWELFFVLPAVALISLFAPERPLRLPPRPKAGSRKRQAATA